jgi:outer membrane autotransporter protein
VDNRPADPQHARALVEQFEAGVLRALDNNALSFQSAVNIGRAGTLDLNGFDQSTGAVSNAGLINMDSGASGSVLTVSGDYAGQGGTIVMNTALGHDASATDRLVVTGNTSGNTLLRIVNTGGPGAPTTGDGIQVVQVFGASNGTFTLAGRAAAGAYEYKLFQHGLGLSAANANALNALNALGGEDGHWYLRSSLRAETALDSAAPGLASRLGLAMLGTYTQRTGDSGHRFDMQCAQSGGGSGGSGGGGSGGSGGGGSGGGGSEAAAPCRAWARAFGETGEFGRTRAGSAHAKDGPAYRYDYGGMQAGVDLLHTPADKAGIYAGAATLRARVKHFDGSRAGRVSMQSVSLGAYWTHHNPAGWYTDLTAQASTYQNIKTRSDAGARLDTHGTGLTASAEVGWVIGLGRDLTVVPQAQLAYQRTGLSNGGDGIGQIQYRATREVHGRVGANVVKTWPREDGRVFTAWAGAHLWRQFGGRAKTTFASLRGENPVTIPASLGGAWAQMEVGLSGQINRAVSLYGAATYNQMLDQHGHGIGLQAGVRIRW